MMRRVGAWTVVLAVLAGLLGGCGKDEKRLTEAQFIAQGNAICRTVADRITIAANQAFPNGSDAAGDDLVVRFAKDIAIPELEVKFKQLGALKAPKDLKDRFEIGVAKARSILEEVKKDPARLAKEAKLFGEANLEFGEVGLTDCAR